MPSHPRRLRRWFRRFRRLREPVSLTLLIVIFLLTLPLTVPITMLLIARDQRRLRAAAKRTRCPQCGQTLGLHALKRAEEKWLQYNAYLSATYPGTRWRRVRGFDAICVNCGTSLRFCYQSRSFAAIAPTEVMNRDFA